MSWESGWLGGGVGKVSSQFLELSTFQSMSETAAIAGTLNYQVSPALKIS